MSPPNPPCGFVGRGYWLASRFQPGHMTPVLPSGSPTLSLSSASLLCSYYLFLLSCWFLSVLTVDIDSLWRSSILQITSRGRGAMKGKVHCLSSVSPLAHPLISQSYSLICFSHFVLLGLCASFHCSPWWTHPLINEL